MKADRKILVISFALLATPLLAAPQDAIATRTSGYRTMGAAYKSVNDQLRSGNLDKASLQAAAARIQATAKAQYGWFPKGSGPEAGVKTAARPEIWTQPAQFKAAQDGFATQAAAFAKAVASGNTATLAAQTKQLGAACSACHRAFRSDVKG